MANRMEEGYNDILQWKQRFDQLFSKEAINSRAFRLEHLSMYERLLRQHTEVNREERVFKVLVDYEKRILERSLYPNPLVRLLRRGIIAVVSVGKKLLEAFRSAQRSGPEPFEGNIYRVKGQKIADAVKAVNDTKKVDKDIDLAPSVGQQEKIQYNNIRTNQLPARRTVKRKLGR